MPVIKILIPDIDNFLFTFNKQREIAYTQHCLSQVTAEWARKINPDYVIPCTQRRASAHPDQMKDFGLRTLRHQIEDGIKRHSKVFHTEDCLQNFLRLTSLTGKLHRVSTGSDRNRQLGDSFENEIKAFEREQKSIVDANSIAEYATATKNPQYNQIIQYARTHLRKNPEDTFEFHIGDDREDLCVMAAHFPEGPDYKIFVYHFDATHSTYAQPTPVPRNFLWQHYKKTKPGSKISDSKDEAIEDEFTLQAKTVINNRIRFASEVNVYMQEFLITGKTKDCFRYRRLDTAEFIKEFANWLRLHCIHLPTELLEHFITQLHPKENAITLFFTEHSFELFEKQLSAALKSKLKHPDCISSDDESDVENEDCINHDNTPPEELGFLHKLGFFAAHGKSGEDKGHPVLDFAHMGEGEAASNRNTCATELEDIQLTHSPLTIYQ